MAIFNYDYNKITKNNLQHIPKDVSDSIKTEVPFPQEVDYKNGYILRYFTQKANDKNGHIYELDSTTYMKLNLNPFYKTISLRWKITGTDEEIREANYKSVKLASADIPLILKHLQNYLQFRERKDLEI